MITLLTYLFFILKHKWYVLYYGWQMRVPLWQLLVHDWSKFLWGSEFIPYMLYFYHYKDEKPEWVRLYFKYAWLNHIHLNPHHWQYWILRNDENGTEVLKMPDNYVLEMVADWKSVGKCITGKQESREWYFEDPGRITLHKETRNQVEGLLMVYDAPDITPLCSCGLDKLWSKKPWYKHKNHCALYYTVVGLEEAMK